MTIHAPTYPADVLTLTTDTPLTTPFVLRRRTPADREARLAAHVEAGVVSPEWAESIRAAWEAMDAHPPRDDSPATSLCDDCGRLVPMGHGQVWPPFWVCYDCHPPRDDSPAALIARLTAGDDGHE